jgi:putative Mn2+ efflux pump MntP
VRRHDLDLVSLIAGVLFAMIALVHLVGAATDEAVDPRWIAPVLLVGLGVAGLAGALRGTRDDQPERSGDTG